MLGADDIFGGRKRVPPEDDSGGWGISGGLLGLLGGLALCSCFVFRKGGSGGGYGDRAEHGGQLSGLVPALEASRPWRLADVKYKLAGLYSHVRLMQEARHRRAAARTRTHAARAACRGAKL